MPSCRYGLLVIANLLCIAICARGDDWPQWRGPAGDGTSGETGLPLAWTDSTGIAWKCELPPWGVSTPAISGDALFLTSQSEDGRLVLLRIDKRTGRIEWTRQEGAGSTQAAPAAGKDGQERRRQKFNPTHNLASPSPVTDGKLVVVHFGNGDLAAYDFAGERLWQRNLQKDYGDYTIWWGHANSPVLCGDLVISACMQDSLKGQPGEPSPSYLVAHDKQTGRQAWKTPRMTSAADEDCDSYATPILWHRGPRVEVVVLGGQVLDGYDPATGRRLWHMPNLAGSRVIPSPVAARDMIYLVQGKRKPLLAVRPGGPDERPRSDVVWSYDQRTTDSPTPVVCGPLFFMVNNEGYACCLDARTGEAFWTERLKGQYYASPLAAEGRIYFLNTKGLCTVISASRRFERVAENQLEDETVASPAISDGRFFIRGRKWLYCLGK
ncbi:MAG: PQQ-binding-like beta-propeller repeat protein [Thermoguttaceae bacterium]|jgi:outer membrane protein assembly factor BamB